MQTLNIPKPCSYGWDKMSLNADNSGRHCAACDKIVVDFTTMTTDQIVNFLERNKGSRVCGHFRTIDTSATSWYHKPILNLYHRIDNKYRKNILLVTGLFFVGLLLNLTGCQQHTEGEMIAPEDTLTQVDSYKAIKVDSTKKTN